MLDGHGYYLDLLLNRNPLILFFARAKGDVLLLLYILSFCDLVAIPLPALMIFFVIIIHYNFK